MSSDVEDRRGASGGGGFGGFGRGPTIGCGGAIILLVLSLLTGKNFFALFDGSGGGVPPSGQTQTAAPVNETPEERQRAEFISDALDDTQDTFTEIFQREGLQYQRSTLVLYRDLTQTGCGTGQAVSGPFYCPADGKVYLDLSFFDELDRRFGAPGDFAQAYVVAHEIGHHVQNLVGTSDRVQEAMRSDRRNANEYSVRLELQADCYAGVWAASAAKRGVLETGDIEEGLGAASAVGDDRMQEMSGRGVNPDAFTHGSAAQRMEWFQRGMRSGNLRDCDTFK
jgi:predicted metalloprotease